MRFAGVSVIYFAHTLTHTQIACYVGPTSALVGNVAVGIPTSGQRTFLLELRRRNITYTQNVGPSLGRRWTSEGINVFFLVLFSP